MATMLTEGEVSTHASVRRRPALVAATGLKLSFNSRLREEATLGKDVAEPMLHGFNSRLREEATIEIPDVLADFS